MTRIPKGAKNEFQDESYRVPFYLMGKTYPCDPQEFLDRVAKLYPRKSKRICENKNKVLVHKNDSK